MNEAGRPSRPIKCFIIHPEHKCFIIRPDNKCFIIRPNNCPIVSHDSINPSGLDLVRFPGLSSVGIPRGRETTAWEGQICSCSAINFCRGVVDEPYVTRPAGLFQCISTGYLPHRESNDRLNPLIFRPATLLPYLGSPKPLIYCRLIIPTFYTTFTRNIFLSTYTNITSPWHLLRLRHLE